ncbi:hypothetical protein JX266_004812 [Neoarthrinium moseri]|nr:hypothetical protein JX266_004812 [Neoarthrinium moseri]
MTGTSDSMPPQLGSEDLQVEKVVCVIKSPLDTTLYEILSLEEREHDGVKSFEVTTQPSARPPQSLLDELLVENVPDYLCESDTRKVHVVVSTGSGTALAQSFYQSALRPVLEKFGLAAANTSSDGPSVSHAASDAGTYALTITQDAQSIRRFARDLSMSTKGLHGSGMQHTVVLLSGDGGIVELLNGKAPIDEVGMSDTSRPLIIMLPLGTGNALFHSLHKPLYATAGSAEPSPLVLGLRTLLKGQTAPLPSFRVDFSAGSRTITYVDPAKDHSSGSEQGIQEQSNAATHLYGAIVASYGFHSQLVWESDTPEYRKHGAQRFQMVAAELLKESHAYNATVELGSTGESTSKKLDRGQHAYILATMVSNLEKTFTISPASIPLDGKLRLIHFGAVGGQKTMDIMMQAYNNGNHVGMEWTADDGRPERVGYDEVKQVKVTTDEADARWRKVCIDGTIVEIPKGGSMTIATEEHPHLQVLVHQSLKAA